MNSLQIYRGTEDIVIPEIAIDETLENMIKYVERFDFKTIKSSSPKYKQLIKYSPTLSPSQILEISKYLKTKQESWTKIDYISKLIQTSYIAGNNDFTIDNKKEDWVASELTGRKNNRLKIKILSNTREFLGDGSNYCNITAEQNVEHTGWNLENCFVDIKQNLDELGILNSSNSTFKIKGKIKIDRIRDYRNIKIILNPEEYEKWHPKLKDDKGIKLEMIKE